MVPLLTDNNGGREAHIWLERPHMIVGMAPNNEQNDQRDDCRNPKQHDSYNCVVNSGFASGFAAEAHRTLRRKRRANGEH
ncbi:MAG: hypothetical protein WCC59_17600 [Terriglobales bacterium]